MTFLTCIFFHLLSRHKVICEISQNIRYQYIFIILWIFLTIGVFVAVAGLFHFLFMTLKSVFWIYSTKLFGEDSILSDKVHSQLTIREMEYLDKIKEMDITMYGEILRELTRFKPDIHTIKKFNTAANIEMVTVLPTAPVDVNRHIMRAY